METKEYRFRVSAFVKGKDGKCIKHVFKEGFEPGVLTYNEYTIEIKPCDLNSTMIAAHLIDREDEIIKSTIGARTEEIK